MVDCPGGGGGDRLIAEVPEGGGGGEGRLIAEVLEGGGGVDGGGEAVSDCTESFILSSSFFTILTGVVAMDILFSIVIMQGFLLILTILRI